MDDGSEAALVVTARELVDQASAILLDFDGPMCSIFAGVPAARVAKGMRRRLLSLDPTTTLGTSDDPLDVLRAARDHSSQCGRVAEGLLSTAEIEAVTVAEPTDGALEFLEAMHDRGTPVAIVSNNGTPAIRAYLERHSMSRFVATVIGRDPSDARLMKPHPHSLALALTALEREPASTVMIGDSLSDVQAALSLGVRAIGFANKPHKITLFGTTEVDATILHMRELAS